MILSIINNYIKVEGHIKWMIASVFFLELINAAFFLLLNYYMVSLGYDDIEITDLISYRFIAVMFFAFPLGLYIKGRKLKSFFWISAIAMPLLSLGIIEAIYQHWGNGLYALVMLWGVSFSFIKITGLPFILLNAKIESHSESISMYFQSWSVAICTVGFGNYALNYLNPDIFDEKLVLQIVSVLAMLSIYCIYRIKLTEKTSKSVPVKQILSYYDWDKIFYASVPTFLIAIGAGFTIPVINLFFLNVHGVTSNVFSVLGASTYVLVAIGMTFMPSIRRRFGYGVAIVLFQSLAVVSLFFMATTEYYSEWMGAVYVAVFFYLVRQPLMNVASPMTSELTMYYVGKKNQEIISALNASIWTGSWFVSMQLFSMMRAMEFQYVSIFLITVSLYIVGIVSYVFLIRAYSKQMQIVE